MRKGSNVGLKKEKDIMEKIFASTVRNQEQFMMYLTVRLSFLPSTKKTKLVRTLNTSFNEGIFSWAESIYTISIDHLTL